MLRANPCTGSLDQQINRYNEQMPTTSARTGRRALNILHSGKLNAIPWLVHGFSTRVAGVSKAYGGGALNLGLTPEDTAEAVERNRAAFLQALGAVDSRGRAWPLASARQVHSSVIHRVDGPPAAPLIGDGLITATPRLLLSVRTADCIPVLIADGERRAVGAFHAGWRGTLARIVEKGVGEMRRNFGSDPAELFAAIGPGVHHCCYAVGDEVRFKFESQFPYASELFHEVFSSDPVRRKYPLLFLNQRAPGHGEPPRESHLDLAEANRRQLLEAGIPSEHITVSELCTSCRTDLLFSHRKEQGKTGRMMAAIGIRKSN